MSWSFSLKAKDILYESTLRLAGKDGLTTLPNRFWLMNFLRSRIEDAHGENFQMALLFVDLDDFRTIKYTFGHVLSNERPLHDSLNQRRFSKG